MLSTTQLPGTPYKRRKHAQRRNDLIAAAAQVFAAKGYHAATTADIAERLNMRAGSLYYYFRSKEAALEAVCRKTMESFRSAMNELLEQDLPPLEIIRRLMMLHLDPDWRPYAITFIHNRRFLPEPAATHLREAAASYLGEWPALFRRAVEAGDLARDLDCDTAGRAALSLCNGVTPAVERESRRDYDRLRRQIVELFFSGILPRS